MNADDVRDLPSLLDYIGEHKASIAVRGRNAATGTFGSVFLTDLAPDEAITWTIFFVRQFMERGFVPHRLVGDKA